MDKTRLPTLGECDDRADLFNESMCYVEDPHTISSQLVQISVCEEEIGRRIQCFVEKKRKEIDLCNIMDFTLETRKQGGCHQESTIQDKENESLTCARVNSFVVKQEFSKCHLKVRRVQNNSGPQTRPDYLYALDKLMIPNGRTVEPDLVFIRRCSGESNMFKHSAMLERLENIEEHLNLPRFKIENIYQRLRVIEDRLLYLESISPEYAHFLHEKSQESNPGRELESSSGMNRPGLSVHEKKVYTISELDAIIQRFEERKLDQSSFITD